MERYEWWNTNRIIKWNRTKQNKKNKRQSNGIRSVIYLLYNHALHTQYKRRPSRNSIFFIYFPFLKCWYDFITGQYRLPNHFFYQIKSLIWIDLFILYFTVKILTHLSHTRLIMSFIHRMFAQLFLGYHHMCPNNVWYI